MIPIIKLIFAIITFGYALIADALPVIANLRLDTKTKRRDVAGKPIRQTRALKMGVATALSDLRSPAIRRQTQALRPRTLSKIRQLQSVDSAKHRLLPDVMQPVNHLVDNVFSIIDGGWRSMSAVNADSIPAVKTVLSSLNSASDLVNGMSSGLSEVHSVFNGLGVLQQSASQPHQSSGNLARNLKNSGLFGIAGALQSVPQQIVAAVLPATFQSALFSRLPQSASESAPVENVESRFQQLAEINSKNGPTIAAAEEEMQELGAEIAALITLFSGGNQLPFMTTLDRVNQSFSPLNIS